MLPYKNILVPYDGSPYSKKALHYAIAFAGCCENASLYIATVSSGGSALSIANEGRPLETDDGQVDLAEADKMVPEEIPHKVIFEIGETIPMLLYVAGEVHADLIIMGNRGRSHVKSLLLGSVSSELMKKAKCPVFIIK